MSDKKKQSRKSHLKVKSQIIVKAKRKKMLVAASVKKEEYDRDFSGWALHQAKFLKKGEFDKLDIDNLIEEIEDLSRRERDRLISHLENLLMHELKAKYQPEMHSASWDASIKEAKFKVQKVIKDNPSLKPHLKNILSDAYYAARLKAVRDTGLEEKNFPEECPWKLNEVFSDLEKKYLK